MSEDVRARLGLTADEWARLDEGVRARLVWRAAPLPVWRAAPLPVYRAALLAGGEMTRAKWEMEREREDAALSALPDGTLVTSWGKGTVRREDAAIARAAEALAAFAHDVLGSLGLLACATAAHCAQWWAASGLAALRESTPERQARKRARRQRRHDFLARGKHTQRARRGKRK